MLQRAKAVILAARAFVLPELSLSFYSEKEPVLLSEAKRISVDDVCIEEGALRLVAGGKPLMVAINPDGDVVERLAGGDVSALSITVDSMENFKEEIVDGFVNKEWLYNLYAHKVFGRFLQASDKLLVAMRGQRLRVAGCPIQMRVYQGNPYADFEQDCMSCMFAVDTSEEGVIYCTGGKRLASVEDFNRSLEERQALYDEFLQPDKVAIVMSGVCPHCGGKLVEKKGENGMFLGCDHYPFCHFTAERLPGGTVSFSF